MPEIKITMPENPPAVEFPLYAVCVHNKSLAFFHSETSATYIHAETRDHYKTGDVVRSVPSCFKESQWQILPKGSKIEIAI